MTLDLELRIRCLDNEKAVAKESAGRQLFTLLVIFYFLTADEEELRLFESISLVISKIKD